LAWQRHTVQKHRAIGLFGGSFNPAHEGHVEASEMALKRLALDEVWWLVSPANPLKDKSVLAPFEERCAGAERLARHPRIKISRIEHEARLTYTHDTVRRLVRSHRDINFVWLMGADNLATFHRWERWGDLFRLVPVAVIDRPGYRFAALASPAAQRFSASRIDESDAAGLAFLPAPSWCFLSGLLNPLSSTRLRGSAAA